MTKPTAKEIKAMAEITGLPVDADVAGRIAHSIGPAFEGFAPVAGTLPFDLEPATFPAGAGGKGVRNEHRARLDVADIGRARRSRRRESPRAK